MLNIHSILLLKMGGSAAFLFYMYVDNLHFSLFPGIFQTEQLTRPNTK